MFVNINPADVEHGDTEQSMAVFVEGVTEPTEVVVNVTSLSEAGVDLSNATVETTGTDSSVDATLTRHGDAVLVRVTLDPGTDTPTDFDFGLTLRGLDTTNASHTRLAYVVEHDDERGQTQRFSLENPDLPWVSTLTRTERLLTGQRNTSQTTRINLDGVPATETATVRVDLSALTARNVSLADASLSAELTDPEQGATLRRAELRGSTVELTLHTERETDVWIDLTVGDLDTRGADPAEDLRYVVAFESPAGTSSGTTDPFGLYAPGNTPTPTASPTDGLTVTPTPPLTPTATADGTSTPTASTPTASSPTDANTPTPGSAGPGFGVVVALIALVGCLWWVRSG